MRVTLAVVVSLDGKLTRGDDPNIHEWSSLEDQAHFIKLRDASDAIIMGSGTYQAVKPQPDAQHLRIILTYHPERYQAEAIPGQLEFMQATLQEVIDRLQRDGHQQVLLASGGGISHDFLAAGLVDEVYITFEPLLFGFGKSFISDQPLDVQLQLADVRRLNDKGTLLAHYTVKK